MQSRVPSRRGFLVAVNIKNDKLLAIARATACTSCRSTTVSGLFGFASVFAYVADPLGAGFVDSLNRPGGNTTGFTVYEYTMGGKWLELLKEITVRQLHGRSSRGRSSGRPRWLGSSAALRLPTRPTW
jgi:hypothetical protein